MEGTVHVLDDYYLAITLLITVAYQLIFFAVAFTFKFDKLTDFAGGTNFVVLAIITLSLSASHPTARQIVASIFIMLWGARLSGFLLFRILKTGKDDRFDDKRDRFFPFLGFWVFQMLWVWIVSLPVTVLNSPAVTQYPFVAFGTGRDIAGVVLFVLGFVAESVSDVEKFIFRQSQPKSAVCDKGLWGWSRHPNYFGEIIIQFAIYMIAVSSAADGHVQGQAYKALYATIVGPIFLTALLMFLSGLPLSERPGAKKRYEKGDNWDGYRRYLDRTSILIPFPPWLYEKVPTVLRRTVFLEFPMYVFDPAKHSNAGGPGGEEQRRAEEGGGSINRERLTG
ncbi:DUF1295-domain-containing protein [Cryphonectria parasitica EP155]|uniref:DUF1295-domain-containing protein n=1 Tax=Cryphonectria parasitica (strain ATCC 38755 / EP155) TaxID=660469 RepID=A0A9P4Y0Q1_CRYP1|nr:DUF1295-domain-containing protein [Cryphonectria parasitica EP155]KAF3764533.1 DUF1295-domain-containing protein [Cryphonectria parasitica EP155]